MNCPACGNEMEKGRLTAGGYSMRWLPEDSLNELLDKVVVSKASFSTKGVPAYICQTCRRVIAEY